MTKDEALQKVNDYCSEKSYTNATLTDGFKDKFAEHLAKRYPDASADDETMLGDMKFALNTAFSGASLIITEKTSAFTSKENEYKNQIAELNKKIEENVTPPPTLELPKDVKDKLERLEQFQIAENKRTKYASIMEIAKKGVRDDLLTSFTTYVKDFDVDLNKDDKEQADKWVEKFQEVMKPSIGNIKPLAPQVTQKRDQEFLESLPKISIK